MGSSTAPFTVLRLLTPLKMSYEAAKTRAEPYTKIVGELLEMRRDNVELERKAVAENRRAYMLVNNQRQCPDDGAGTCRCATQLVYLFDHFMNDLPFVLRVPNSDPQP
jgi:hypothetical protein